MLKYIAIAALVLPSLAACHTDPFSIKPEVPITLPEKPVDEVAETEAPAPVETDMPEEVVVEPTPVVEEERIPFTDKLVRGIVNGSTVVLKTGETITFALNANRDGGYQWEMQPLDDGLELVGDYFRTESPWPDRAMIGGARYFLVRADRAGDYPIVINHANGTDVRASKRFTLSVSDPASE